MSLTFLVATETHRRRHVVHDVSQAKTMRKRLKCHDPLQHDKKKEPVQSDEERHARAVFGQDTFRQHLSLLSV